jgi:hypothetical protein
MAGKTIGPRMKDVLDIVMVRPGITRRQAAKWVGPHGSETYGYQTVNRAIRAGIVVGRRISGQRGIRLFPNYRELSHIVG